MASERWLVEQQLDGVYKGVADGNYVFMTPFSHILYFKPGLLFDGELQPGGYYQLQFNSEKTRARAIPVNVGLKQYGTTNSALAVPRGITSTILDPQYRHFVRISMLDVGQGDSTFVYDSYGVSALIDFGSKKNADVTIEPACQFIFETLSGRYSGSFDKILTINLLCFTHGDGDHYNQFEKLLAYVKVKGFTLQCTQAYLGGKESDYPKEFLTLLGKCTGSMYFLDSHAELPKLLLRLGHLNLTVLSANQVPTHSSESVKNCSSLAILIRVTHLQGPDIATYLVMGDGEQSVEEALLEKCTREIRNIDALRVGHHGSRQAGSAGFLSHTAPRVAYISTDTKWAHPYPDVMERLRATSSLGSSVKPHPVVTSADGDKFNYQSSTESTAIFTTIVAMETDVSEEGKAKVQKNPGVTPVIMTGARHDFFVDIDSGKISIDNSSNPNEVEELASRKS
ncbi:ComEC/Rec2 family competence protein [Pseudomonas sp. McL0111]|uniref:ComEC/Rec2 family competence protein n=1 Tax=Pseudomonas sp. McL0111 TaxID=3457357 RepID=UPI00403EAC0A